MVLSYLEKRNLKSVIIFTIFLSIGAILNGIVEHGFKFYPILNEFIMGSIFGLCVSILEIHYFEKKLRRVHFSTTIFIRIIFYIILMIIIVEVVDWLDIGNREGAAYQHTLIKSESNLDNYVTSDEFIQFLLCCLILTFIAIFMRQINKLLGQNVLLNYVKGRYHPAFEEQLIFMFLDLKSSTTIAEKIGLEKNHEFLNDFFHDTTDSILECKGIIYQYVGDEIVLTWNLKDGAHNLNCLNLFFHIQKRVENNKQTYLDKYGVYPEFKSGLHFGKVIAGEMGDIKKDIVYHGDTVNTAARIQAECNKYGKKVLISKDLLDNLDLTDKYKAESMGFIKLRGKEKELELYAIEEA
jgi:adenylate cyclase